METNQSLLHNKSGNGLINNLKASKNTITDLNFVQDGDSTLPPGRRTHLRHHAGNKAAAGSQIEDVIRGKHHPGLNSNFSFFFYCSEMSFRLPENLIFWQSTRCVNSTFSHAQMLRSLVAVLLSWCTYSHTLTSMHLHGSSHEAHCLRFAQRTCTPHRAMSYTLQNLTPRTGTLSPSFPEPVFQRAEQPCEDRRPQLSGALAEPRPCKGYEPKQLAEDRDEALTEIPPFTESVLCSATRPNECPCRATQGMVLFGGSRRDGVLRGRGKGMRSSHEDEACDKKYACEDDSF